MPAGLNPTLTNPPGGQEPAPALRMASAHRFSKMKSMRPPGQLSESCKAALVALGDGGQAIHGGGLWFTPTGTPIRFQTIEALFARGCIAIGYPGRKEGKPGRHVARLTETGSLLALGIKAERSDDFETSKLVYGDEG